MFFTLFTVYFIYYIIQKYYTVEMETSVDAVDKPISVFREDVAKIVSDRSYENNIYYQRKKIKEAKLERERLQIELEKLKEVNRNQERLRQQSHRKKSRHNIINNKRNDLKPYRSSLEYMKPKIHLMK